MTGKLKIKIKRLGFLDLLSFKNLVPVRKKRFANASSTKPDEAPPMNELSVKLHPIRQYLVVKEVIEELPDVKTLILVPDSERGTTALAYFRAGQYLSLKIDVNGTLVTRPYSIASSPAEALLGHYAVTIKKQAQGFVTDFIFDQWVQGTRVEASGPEGQFYYERLRDMPHIVGIAGGSGITPFMSMATQFEKEGYPVAFTLFYGCNSRDEIVFYDQLNAMVQRSEGRFRIVYVLCDNAGLEDAEQGFITAKIIRKYVDPAQCSIFICGPQAMYDYIKGEISTFNLPIKQVRREVFGEVKNVSDREDYPIGVKDSFTLTVIKANKKVVIPALSNESLLVALERGGIKPPSKCRSGVCSFCRSELVSGQVYIPADTDGRRAADKKFSFLHPCVSYPISDIELIVPGDEVI